MIIPFHFLFGCNNGMTNAMLQPIFNSSLLLNLLIILTYIIYLMSFRVLNQSNLFNATSLSGSPDPTISFDLPNPIDPLGLPNPISSPNPPCHIGKLGLPSPLSRTNLLGGPVCMIWPTQLVSSLGLTYLLSSIGLCCPPGQSAHWIQLICSAWSVLIDH